jgi:hypothetical protein
MLVEINLVMYMLVLIDQFDELLIIVLVQGALT